MRLPPNSESPRQHEHHGPPGASLLVLEQWVLLEALHAHMLSGAGIVSGSGALRLPLFASLCFFSLVLCLLPSCFAAPAFSHDF